MSAIKGLSGFVVGLGIGGAALIGTASVVPQIEELAFLQPSEAEETTDVETEQVVEVDDSDTPEVAIEEDAAVEKAETVDQVEPKNDEAVTDVTEKNEEPADDTVKTEEVATEETASEDEVAILTPEPTENAPDVNPEEEKKFKLPTIEPEEPEAPVEEVVEEAVEDEGIKIGQKPSSSLPSITPEEPEVTTPDAKEEVQDGNALEFNATAFEGSDRPLMGVILQDIGDKGLKIEDLKKLNAPITIAIDADMQNASERALAYKAAGFEVVAMAPSDRTAALNIARNSQEVNDALDVLFTSVPNAIGMIDNPLAKLQKNSRTSDVVVDNFVETGHGLITYAKGLNSVDRSAKSKGVKASKVSRILDANRENKALMLRYLDRVSLDAGRDGEVIILGTTSKETVAVLAGWIFSSKGQSVAIAPASAVLLGK